MIMVIAALPEAGRQLMQVVTISITKTLEELVAPKIVRYRVPANIKIICPEAAVRDGYRTLARRHGHTVRSDACNYCGAGDEQRRAADRPSGLSVQCWRLEVARSALISGV